ncbi:MAG: hypothetical protein D6683_05410 [Actinomyces sp.]|nr:MAG: hypothetical protein D6683_05410 [Actinomyces sp.]
MEPPPYELVPGRYGISLTRTGEAAVSCRVPALPATLDDDGALRAAAVLMGIDMGAGLAAGLGVLPRWSVTADAFVVFVGRCRVGPLRVDARCVRAGRRLSLAEFRAVDEGAGDAPVAWGTAGHGVLEPDFDPLLASAPVGAEHHFPRPPSNEAARSLEDQFGITSGVDEVTGGVLVRAPLDERTRNPWGIFHGGLYGLLVCDVLGAARLGAPRVLGLRFVNPVREKAAEARVVPVDGSGGGVSGGDGSGGDRFGRGAVRVVVTDAGSGRTAVLADVVVDPTRAAAD